MPVWPYRVRIGFLSGLGAILSGFRARQPQLEERESTLRDVSPWTTQWRGPDLEGARNCKWRRTIRAFSTSGFNPCPVGMLVLCQRQEGKGICLRLCGVVGSLLSLCSYLTTEQVCEEDIVAPILQIKKRVQYIVNGCQRSKPVPAIVEGPFECCDCPPL